MRFDSILSSSDGQSFLRIGAGGQGPENDFITTFEPEAEKFGSTLDKAERETVPFSTCQLRYCLFYRAIILRMQIANIWQ